ncbi:MAG TPA: protein kinase, partial [Haliangium sp.]|nr:protein kinase [Haliangium sp.]
ELAAICPRHAAASLHEEPRATAAAPVRPAVPGHVVVDLLGAGAHAAVWRARRLGGPGPATEAASEVAAGATGDVTVDLAIKVAIAPTAQAQERTLRERDMLARIGPPHVPALLDHGVLADGRVYLVLEKLVGPTLGARMSHMRAPPVLEVAAALADEVLTALAAMHAAGVVHGDLKPDNVFIEHRGANPRAVLVDLGLARPVGASSPGPPSAAGTLLYMAPEQFDGASADPRADVYAAGVLLFELLTLQPPFGGDASIVELGHRVRRPPRPSSIAPVARPLEDLILRCLAKDPHQRPPDAGALRVELGAAFAAAARLASMPATSTPPVGLPALAAAGATAAGVTAPDAAAAGATAAAAGPARARGQRRHTTVAVAFLQANAGTEDQDIQEAIEAAGGWLADFTGSRYAVVFTHEATDNPVRRAVDVAQSLVDRDLCRRAIVDLASVQVRWRASGQPWFVSNVFSRAERYPTESDPEGVTLSEAVAAALPSLGGDAGTYRTARAAPRLSLRPTTARLRALSAPFVGREALLADLLADFRTAMRETRPALTTLLGQPGLGKSCIAGVLAERMAEHYPWVQVRELRAYAPVGGDSPPLLRELLTWVLGLPSRNPGDAGRELVEQRLGPELGREAWCGVALAMGWLGPDAAPVRELGVAPGTLRTATARALGEALVRLARKRPQMLLLDDAQWADDIVLDALEHATAAGRSAEIWCVVLARPSFADIRSTWGQRAASHHRRQLEPLAGDDARELCRQLLEPATDVPGAIIDRLVARADRVPMLLVELVRGLVRQGLVKPRDRSTGWYVDTDVLGALPDTPLLDWLTQRELEALTPEQAAHARMVSLLGPEFSGDAVEGVLASLDRDGHMGEFLLDARIGLEQLVSCGLLFAHRRGTFSFRHALIREAVAATVDPGSAVHIHRAAYEYYCGSTVLASSDRLSRLAWHAEQHGARPAALDAYRAMAEEARDKHDYLRAEQLFTRVLALTDEDDWRGRMAARRGRGIMRYRLARHQDAIADLAAARADARALGDVEAEMDLLLDEAMALDWLGRFEPARELAEAAESLLHRCSSPRLEARVLKALGRAAVRAEELDRATTLLARAAGKAAAVGDAGYEILVVSQLMLGGLYAWLHRLDEAELVFERVISLCRSRNDTLHLAAALGNRVHLWAAHGDWERMSADLEEHLALAQVLGNAWMERNAHHSVAAFCYWRGDLESARKHLARMIAFDEQGGEGGQRPEGSLLLARIELAAGNLDLARALAFEIHAHQTAAERADQREALLRPSDSLLLAMVTLAVRGDADPAAWEDLVSRAQALSLAQELCEIRDAQARTALRAGNVAAARAAWQTALASAQPGTAFMLERLAAATAALPASAGQR